MYSILIDETLHYIVFYSYDFNYLICLKQWTLSGHLGPKAGHFLRLHHSHICVTQTQRPLGPENYHEHNH